MTTENEIVPNAELPTLSADDSLKKIVEAALFASGSVLKLARIKDAFETDCQAGAIKKAIDELNEDYRSTGRVFEIREIAGGYQMMILPEFHDSISRIEKKKEDTKLSNAALETLSIIAYKQPLTRASIEAIRGVQCGPILRALLEKGLIKIAGREDMPGNPVLYATSEQFLEITGVKSIKELPKTEELK